MMPASTTGARRFGITLESANWPQKRRRPVADVLDLV